MEPWCIIVFGGTEWPGHIVSALQCYNIKIRVPGRSLNLIGGPLHLLGGDGPPSYSKLENPRGRGDHAYFCQSEGLSSVEAFFLLSWVWGQSLPPQVLRSWMFNIPQAWIPSLADSHGKRPEEVITEALYATTPCLVIPHLAHDIDGEA